MRRELTEQELLLKKFGYSKYHTYKARERIPKPPSPWRDTEGNILIGGRRYKLVAMGGFGVSRGLDSTVEALDEPDCGRRYRCDIGQGHELKEPITEQHKILGYDQIGRPILNDKDIEK